MRIANNGKRNLVLLRAGEVSLHTQWFTEDRQFDLVVDSYIADPSKYEGTCDLLFRGMGETAYPAFANIFEQNPEWLETYDAVWFPDDDIEISTEGVNLLFQLHHEAQADLSQPALTPDSYFGHHITVQHQGLSIRETNFVEVMVPMFSRKALQACLPTFTESRSGWGLDYAWQAIVSGFDGSSAIFDCIPVRHTKPVGGGSLYDELTESPQQECDRIMAKYGLSQPYVNRTIAAWDDNFEAVPAVILEHRLQAAFPVTAHQPTQIG